MIRNTARQSNLAEVCAAALVKYPRFNASIDMSNRNLIFKKYVHIGIEAAHDIAIVSFLRSSHYRRADAARFLAWICATLEQPMTLVLE